MAPLEHRLNPRTGGLDTGLGSPDSSFRMRAVYNNDTRQPPSPSVPRTSAVPCVGGASSIAADDEDFEMPKLVRDDKEISINFTKSQLRIRELRRNKRRAEHGFGAVRSQMDSLQQENARLLAENEELRAQQLEYAEMMRRATELIYSLEEAGRDAALKEALNHEKSNQVPEDLANIEGEQDEDDSDEALVPPKTALEMTLLNNKLTIELLDDERQRSLTEMNHSLERKTSQVEQLQQEKKNLSQHSKAQEATIATLEEQNELKGAKIDILENMVRSLLQEKSKDDEPLPEGTNAASTKQPEDGSSCSPSCPDRQPQHLGVADSQERQEEVNEAISAPEISLDDASPVDPPRQFEASQETAVVKLLVKTCDDEADETERTCRTCDETERSDEDDLMQPSRFPLRTPTKSPRSSLSRMSSPRKLLRFFKKRPPPLVCEGEPQKCFV